MGVKVCSIYLNRSCPRNCPYCSVPNKEKEKNRLSVEQWKEAFDILYEAGIRFFLILGTEPLLLKEDLVELVKFWKERDYEYGLYSTSPRPLFDEWRDKLVESGLRNWSSGIDFIPEVYEATKDRLTSKAKNLIEREKGGLVKKALDGLYGIKYMEEKGVEELLALITISRMNIEMVPDMVVYLIENFSERLRVAFNYVERGGGDLDFAPPDIGDYGFTEQDFDVWLAFIYRMRKIAERYRLRVQIPFEYLEDWDRVLRLDKVCSVETVGIGVEVDGSLRKCGYRTGTKIKQYTVWDLRDKKEEVFRVLEEEVKSCKGCYWAYPLLIEVAGTELVDFRSRLWRERIRKVKGVGIKEVKE